ncbi:MAG: glycosyltransferase family 4 protein [Proteobacteria bacterium]|nr:glycosyltransferase family 4 protein [Pseudomonadota bacterium]
MKIAFYKWKARPFSIATYTDEVVAELTSLGVEFVSFGGSDPVPDSADLYWDPGTGRPGPHYRLREVGAPLVVTYHGAANLALKIRHCFGSGIRTALRAASSRRMTRRQWKLFSGKKLSVIAVSEYAKHEAASYLHLNLDDITTIYHGAAASAFTPLSSPPDGDERFFLHVSQYQPKKNVDNIIEAYRRLNMDNKLRLVLVCPGFSASVLPPGVELIKHGASAPEIADLYRKATAFVFPSLHETFGMPILEAMACGCPVITSNVTACPEVAGDAALLIDPRSVAELAGAMRRLAEDASLCADLRERGLKRANQFTWRRSAEQHLKVFEDALRESNRK